MVRFSSSSEAWLARAALLAALALAGCMPWWTARSDPPVLGGEPLIPPPSPLARATGSLWRDNVSDNYLFADVKARFPGDLLTILIVEDASGDKEATTTTKTKTSVFGNLAQFFGLPQQLQKKNPDIDPNNLISAEADREWDGEGTTTRKGKLTGSMTAKVTAVSPVGNLWVEGEKIVSVNHEDQHIVLSGWVRPEDIDARNQVLSTRLASARVELYGVGVVATKQRPGWGLQILDFAWPF